MRKRMVTKKGYVDHVVYKNEQNNYAVLCLTNEEEDLMCVGTLGDISPGEMLEVHGEMVAHPIYGEQLQVHSYNPILPDDPISIKRYLGSGAIKGIGEALAGRIVQHFGKETLRIMEEEPYRLSEVKGISEKKAAEISVVFNEKKDSRAAYIFLQEYGISNNLAIKIYDEYGSAIYSIMRENPYRLAEDIRGVSFKTADEIAIKAGINVDSQYRIKSGIMYVLSNAAYEGHLYLPRGILLNQASLLLELPADGISVELDNLAVERKIVVKEPEEVSEYVTGQPQIYLSSYYFAELRCASMLRDLNLYSQEDILESEQIQINKKIDDIEKTLGISLHSLQRQAVFEAVTHGILILSGGPGTGKTTTINAMISYFVDEGRDILLAAPTGRAAKRMTEATGYEAKTIHRLLELSGVPDDDRQRARFERNEDNPLEADVIFIDEMSMVDIFLFQALLNAISPGTRLIMVGDADQLPSVGPGQVLRDLMDSKAFACVVLEEIFRQTHDSDIVLNAHAIRVGKKPEITNKSRDFFFLKRNDVNVIYKHMVQLITEKLPPYVSASSYDIQVLTPTRKGTLGVETLNEILQKYINPPAENKKEIESGNTIFREGDKVMQIKNNYQLEWEVIGNYNIPIDSGMGVFNGDMGVIYHIDTYAKIVTVEYDERRRVDYTLSTLEELELAYATTIHKSQGSEYPAVIIPLLSAPRSLLNRNLLYTAVTRAKSCVAILGSEEILYEMVDNDNTNRRFTGLKNRITEVCL